MKGSVVHGGQRYDVIGLRGSPELEATEAAIVTDTLTAVIDEIQKTWRESELYAGPIFSFRQAIDEANAGVGALAVSWDSLAMQNYEGLPARHYQMTMIYSLPRRDGRREDWLGASAKNTIVADFWVVNLPTNFRNPFVGIGRPRNVVPESIRGEWNKVLALYSNLDRGTIVKFSSTGVMGENSASPVEFVRTVEISEVMAQNIERDSLRVSPDYTRAPRGFGRMP